MIQESSLKKYTNLRNRAASQQELEKQRVGYYQTKKYRNEKVQDLKETNFHLGFDKPNYETTNKVEQSP